MGGKDAASSGTKQDYFLASLEGDGLVMEPHCACGEPLDEDYFCKKCSRQCTCLEVRCDSEAAFGKIRKLIEENPRFHNFHARLIANDGDFSEDRGDRS